MAREQSPDDVRAEHMRTMGADLGELYYGLWSEVSWLHLKWARFLALFAEKKERIDLMNSTAPAFFAELQRLLAEDVLVHISRLTDPPETRLGRVKKPNLTLQRLPGLLPDDAVRATVARKLAELDGKCCLARDWRNRWIAHRDLDLAMKTTDCRPLDRATRETIEEALAGIRDVMNTVLGHFKRARTLYEYTMVAPGDVEQLVYFLEEGLRARRRELDELKASVRPPTSKPRRG